MIHLVNYCTSNIVTREYIKNILEKSDMDNISRVGHLDNLIKVLKTDYLNNPEFSDNRNTIAENIRIINGISDSLYYTGGNF